MLSLLLITLTSASPEHLRLSTSRGPVHVLIHPQAKVTVVYVHGFWTRVDEAWVQHRLPQQLLASGLDATFIAPEAPAGPGEDVVWPELDALIHEVETRAGVTLPATVIAAGHSGAYLTLLDWTSSERVKAFVLLDAFYSAPEPWERWLAEHEEGQLLVVAHSTARRSEPLCRRHARRVHCEHASAGHMEIVTDGEILPRVLRSLSAVAGPSA
jgi:hypothetical protein